MSPLVESILELMLTCAPPGASQHYVWNGIYPRQNWGRLGTQQQANQEENPKYCVCLRHSLHRHHHLGGSSLFSKSLDGAK
jgi:hypothetical protein